MDLTGNSTPRHVSSEKAETTNALPAQGPVVPPCAGTSGSLDVLNCGAGHLEIKFNRGLTEDVERARKMVLDMLARGYAIFVEIDDSHHRVTDFDPEHDCYIVGELEEKAEQEPTPEAPKKRGRPKGSGRSVPMKSVRATGIGPTAGG